MVQLLQLNTLSTSRMRRSPHECEKNEDGHSCNLSDQDKTVIAIDKVFLQVSFI